MIAHRDAFIFYALVGPPKLAVRVAVLACTRSNRRFYIPKATLRRVRPGQHLEFRFRWFDWHFHA